jgi:hypothetical protein
MFYLTDVKALRDQLARFHAAADWAVALLEDVGLANVKKGSGDPSDALVPRDSPRRWHRYRPLIGFLRMVTAPTAQSPAR